MCSDYVFKHLRSEESTIPVVVTKQTRAYLRKRLELCPRRKRMLANLLPTSIKSLSHNSPAVIGYVLDVFDTKNVRIDESDSVVKQWILADIKTSKKNKIWCVKMLAWNEEAIKFATQLPKGTRVLISNFLVKDRLRTDDHDYEGQSPYEIHFTNDTTFSILG